MGFVAAWGKEVERTIDSCDEAIEACADKDRCSHRLVHPHGRRRIWSNQFNVTNTVCAVPCTGWSITNVLPSRVTS